MSDTNVRKKHLLLRIIPNGSRHAFYRTGDSAPGCHTKRVFLSLGSVPLALPLKSSCDHLPVGLGLATRESLL